MIVRPPPAYDLERKCIPKRIIRRNNTYRKEKSPDLGQKEVLP